jgi:hypothetical protein
MRLPKCALTPYDGRGSIISHEIKSFAEALLAGCIRRLIPHSPSVEHCILYVRPHEEDGVAWCPASLSATTTRLMTRLMTKRLGCWCVPLPCRGHTLAEVANCSEEWLCQSVDEAYAERITEEDEKVE